MPLQEIAAHAANQRDHEKAIRLYTESLSYDETDEEATLELANLYLTTNDYDSCEKLCRQLMVADGKAAHDAAFTMMATIMFRKKVSAYLDMEYTPKMAQSFQILFPV